MPDKDFRITCREVLAIQAELPCSWQPPTASGVGYHFEIIPTLNKNIWASRRSYTKVDASSDCCLELYFTHSILVRTTVLEGYCLLKITDVACCKNQHHGPVLSHLSVAWWLTCFTHSKSLYQNLQVLEPCTKQRQMITPAI